METNKKILFTFYFIISLMLAEILFIIWVLIRPFLPIAFTTQTNKIISPVYFENFEKYTSDQNLQKTFTVWSDGANLKASLQENMAHSGKQALAIDIISPNPNNNFTNGSIYHILPFSQRNWSGGTGIRFWVTNASEKPLFLSFNFKEGYNEYWSIAPSGFFFLQSDNGSLHQRSIEYGNLPIPENYSGFVLVPFAYFIVPDWNTARGNKVMELKRIESFAFAVNIGDNYPGKLWIDDIEVLAESDYKTLTIQGAGNILVPESGEYHEQYSTLLGSLSDKTSMEVNSSWSVVQQVDGKIQVDEHGGLTIPAEVKSNQVVLHATYLSEDLELTSEFIVNLQGNKVTEGTQQTQRPTINFTHTPPNPYGQFSDSFENWAVINRPLFVLLLVGAILLFLAILSWFQRRMK